MSADSEPPVTPEAAPQSSGAATPPEEATAPEYLPQKRRHKKSEEPEFNLSGGSDDEIILLSSLLQSLLARKQAATDAPEPARASKINRFVPKNSSPPLPAAPNTVGAVPDEEGDAIPSAPGSESGRITPPPTLPKLTPRAVTADGEPIQWEAPNRGRNVLYLVFCAGLAVAAFLIGRGMARSENAARLASAPAPTPAPTWNATLLGQLDQVLAADHNGDLDKARKQALELRKPLNDPLSLELYLASLTTRIGLTNDAEADLSRLLTPELPALQTAAINKALTFTYVRRRNFKRAAEAVADACRLDPFDAHSYYVWGQILRRQGRFQEAADQFGETLQRLPSLGTETEGLREDAAFKQRLSLIELGHEADLRPAVEQHLNQPMPSGYWLLTAAAAALQRGDFPVATNALQKARETLSADEYSALTDDYFFHAYGEKPGLEAFLPPVPPALRQAQKKQMIYFIDP